MKLTYNRYMLMQDLNKATSTTDIEKIINDYIAVNHDDTLCEFLPLIAKLSCFDLHILIRGFSGRTKPIREIINGRNAQCLFSVDGKTYSFAGKRGEDYLFLDREFSSEGPYNLVHLDLELEASVIF